MAITKRGIQDFLSSGDITDIYIGGQASGDEVLTKDEIMAVTNQASPTTVNAATYTALSDDNILHVTYTTTGACTLTIPSLLIADDTYRVIIKDAGGNAGTNNITVATEGSETINGSATATINSDYSSINIYSDGANLYIY